MPVARKGESGGLGTVEHSHGQHRRAKDSDRLSVSFRSIVPRPLGFDGFDCRTQSADDLCLESAGLGKKSHDIILPVRD